MITILIGDVTDLLRNHAHQLDSTAQLLTSSSNTQLAPGTYYASLGDFSTYQEFVNILDQANCIVYSPPESWSDQNKQGISHMKTWTEHCLFYFNDKKTVTGSLFATQMNTAQILKLADVRKGHDPQVWIVGGSDSHGDGVNCNHRYGQLIANSLKMPVSFLTETGSSLEWATDQILRSDIRTSDIVIWGTVPVSRFPFYHNNSVMHIGIDHYRKHPEFNKQVSIDHLDNQHTLCYRPITCINQVQNICEKLGVQLIIAGLADTSEYTPHLLNFKNYVHLTGRFGLNSNDIYLDVGKDNIHPGPKMHQWYADQIYQKIQELVAIE